MLSLSVIQRVLQNLLRERVPIRDSVTILEALSEGAQMTKNPVLLTEYVRQSIRRVIVSSHTTPQGEVAAYLVEPSAEHAVEAAVEHSEHNSVLAWRRNRPAISWAASRANWNGRILRPWCW